MAALGLCCATVTLLLLIKGPDLCLSWTDGTTKAGKYLLLWRSHKRNSDAPRVKQNWISKGIYLFIYFIFFYSICPVCPAVLIGCVIKPIKAGNSCSSVCGRRQGALLRVIFWILSFWWWSYTGTSLLERNSCFLIRPMKHAHESLVWVVSCGP